jgi:L-fuconolactonase
MTDRTDLAAAHATYVDAHLHLWDPERFRYDWLAAVPQISHRHLPQDFDVDAAPFPPGKWVFVECGAPPADEVRWVEALAAAEPRLVAIVASARMNEGRATAAAIEELRDHSLVRGVRHNFQDAADPRYCCTQTFIEGTRRLGKAGLVFDICCRETQLPAVCELVQACPDTQFVLDHCGKPPIRERRLDPWRRSLRALAAMPNVVCKLSGLATEADALTWRISDLAPYVHHAIDVFGPRRLLYGGDWPVVRLAGGYARWREAAFGFVAALTDSERAEVLGGTATRIYRLH